jgi:hypothetical protein
MTEAKMMKVVSPALPALSRDEIAAVEALAAEARNLQLEDYSLPGVPIEFDRDKAKWVKKLGGGGGADNIDPERPHVADVWSYSLMWNCWRLGANGKKKKVEQVGPVRRIDNVVLPARETLSYRVEGEWEVKNGRPSDPWSRQYGINVKDSVTGDILCWHCGFEGRATLAALFAAYAMGIHGHPGQMPEITFGSAKSFSFDGTARINPALILTGKWRPFGEGRAAPPVPATSATPKTASIPNSKLQPKQVSEEDNEEIPF